MTFILALGNTNLQQAFEMSVYTWAIAILIGLVLLMIEKYKLKTVKAKIKLYYISIFILAPYTILTGLLWFYYFAVVLCLPFFVLQLFSTWRYSRLNSSNKLKGIFSIFIFLTFLLSLLAAWFFGILN